MDQLDSSVVAATIAVLAYVGLVFAAGVSDILTLTVPNRYSVALVLLYPSYVLSAGHAVPWQVAILLAAGAFIVGFVLFALGLWGGGDAKFFAAVTLWAGPDFIVEFALLTVLAGGVIAVFVWLQHYLPHAYVSGFFRFRDGIPKLTGTPIPYAAAIAIAGLYGAFTLLTVG